MEKPREIHCNNLLDGAKAQRSLQQFTPDFEHDNEEEANAEDDDPEKNKEKGSHMRKGERKMTGVGRWRTRKEGRGQRYSL